MADEKTQAQPADKKQDKPPAPAQQQTPKDQHAGPARAAVPQQQPAGHQPASEQRQATPAGQAAALQQSVGNQQVNRTMRAAREPGRDPHAPGVKVSQRQDAAEKEAESVARKVTGDQPAHPRDHPGPAPGDPAKVVGDPSTVHGDPDVVHRAVADHDQGARPQPTARHPAAPQPQHAAPAGPSPTSILDHPGSGQPIPQPSRGTLEARLKADLSHVVVHHDAAADQAARALHAMAVTRGNHIFLASDASPYDLALMAHEVTHVLHHNNDTVHRATRSGTSATATGGIGTESVAGHPGEMLHIDSFQVPDIKKDYTEKPRVPVLIRNPADVRDTKQDDVWRRIVQGHFDTPLDNAIKSGAGTAKPGKPPTPMLLSGATVYYFKLDHADSYVLGTKDKIREQLIVPWWDNSGNRVSFDIDHRKEWQLGGHDLVPDDNNLWLLESSANRSAGSKIASSLKRSIGDVINALNGAGTSIPPYLSGPDTAWPVYLSTIVGGMPLAGNDKINWSRDQIRSGQHLVGLSPMDASDVLTAGLKGSPTELVIYFNAAGIVRKIPWLEAGGKPVDRRTFGPSVTFIGKDRLFGSTEFDLTEVDYKGGKLKGKGFKKSKTVRTVETKNTLDFDFTRYPGIEFGGMLSVGSMLNTIRHELKVNPLSPLEFSDLAFDPDRGITARGKLLPSVPLIAKLDIDVVLDGNEVGLEKTFTARDIPMPRPFKATGGTLTISLSAAGAGARGELQFEIPQFATGSINGKLDTAEGFSLSGALNFDKSLFQPAELSFFYQKKGGKNYEWGLGGHLGIGPKQIPGIKQADITASYQNEQFAAQGAAQLDVPGLQSGSLAITYSERAGISIGGSFGLAPNPVIDSGTVAATVSKRPPGNRWALSASGTVKPKIPGVDTTLSASYENGVFTVEGSVAYARGMLSGSLTVGLTNRPLDPQGHPAGAPRAGAPLRPYGGGTLTARITPWLQGTVGVQLQADGSVQLMGEIALPQSVDLFSALQVQKNLISIGVDIPIVGVAVMGQRIGIFATIQGGLDASASIGPGQLRQLSLRVRYNPEHEDQTQITGGAQLHIPAQAGLRLYVRGALGAGIPVVSAEAGLEIGGRLAVEGAVQAGVAVNWTPKQGLVIDAQASLSAEPSFTFDINGYVKVSADLIFTSVSLYEKHWQLASFRYGSGLRVGVRAPIHYEQGKPFTFSVSDVQFDLPKIDPAHVLADLVRQIA